MKIAFSVQDDGTCCTSDYSSFLEDREQNEEDGGMITIIDHVQLDETEARHSSAMQAILSIHEVEITSYLEQRGSLSTLELLATRIYQAGMKMGRVLGAGAATVNSTTTDTSKKGKGPCELPW